MRASSDSSLSFLAVSADSYQALLNLKTSNFCSELPNIKSVGLSEADLLPQRRETDHPEARYRVCMAIRI